MIRYVKDDLFKTSCDVIAHGCNCLGGYGAGIAKTMAEKYPESKNQYLSKHKNPGWTLGDVQFVTTQGKIIANCATQHAYGGAARYGKVYVDYNAVQKVMETLYQYCTEKNLSIAIPKIGAGLAGGDWNRIEKIINDTFKDREIVVYYI